MLNIGGKYIPKSMLPIGTIGATGFDNFECNLGYGANGRGTLAPQTSIFGKEEQIKMSKCSLHFFGNNRQN